MQVFDFAWNPVQPWTIASASTDNVLQVWTMSEALTTEEDGDEGVNDDDLEGSDNDYDDDDDVSGEDVNNNKDEANSNVYLDSKKKQRTS
jgi:hypothetical protein